MHKVQFFLASLVLALLATTGSQAVTVQQVVDQISTASYKSYLENTIHTHSLDNNCFNMGVKNGVVQHGATHDLDAEAVYTAFRRNGWTTYYNPFNLVQDGTGNLWAGKNVIAVKQGATRPDDIYILSAHYDSTANHQATFSVTAGADDDGSGIAALLEIARVMSPYTFDGTVILAVFDGEEQTVISSGTTYRRIGSVYYAAQLQNQGIMPNVKGMISVDMIAWQSGETAYRNKADLETRTTMTQIIGTLSSAIQTYGGGLVVDVRGNPGDFSDHVSFADYGVQALQLIEDGWWNNPNYHMETDYVDLPGYIDYTYATKMVKSVTGWLCTRVTGNGMSSAEAQRSYVPYPISIESALDSKHNYQLDCVLPAWYVSSIKAVSASN